MKKNLGELINLFELLTNSIGSKISLDKNKDDLIETYSDIKTQQAFEFFIKGYCIGLEDNKEEINPVNTNYHFPDNIIVKEGHGNFLVKGGGDSLWSITRFDSYWSKDVKQFCHNYKPSINNKDIFRKQLFYKEEALLIASELSLKYKLSQMKAKNEEL